MPVERDKKTSSLKEEAAGMRQEKERIVGRSQADRAVNQEERAAVKDTESSANGITA